MKYNLKPLADQVILITGASSGIGLVTARMAAERGAKVMLVARNEAALREAAEGIKASGGEARWHVADVSEADQVNKAAEAAVSRFGRIDTWINNAGVAIYARLLETPADEHEQLFRTNYFGAVNGCTSAVAHLREGGALITVGSIAGDLPAPGMGAYAATKHALRAYVDTLRMELMADSVPISVTLIKPAGIDTPIAQHAANHLPGEARIPPPAYDPAIVAKTILDAAVHSRRDLTVGGAGRAQVNLGTHFPALLDRLAGPLLAAMTASDRKRTPGNTLFRSKEAGRERSGVELARQTSLYTAGERHPIAKTVLGLGALAGVAVLAFRHRRTA